MGACGGFKGLRRFGTLTQRVGGVAQSQQADAVLRPFLQPGGIRGAGRLRTGALQRDTATAQSSGCAVTGNWSGRLARMAQCDERAQVFSNVLIGMTRRAVVPECSTTCCFVRS